MKIKKVVNQVTGVFTRLVAAYNETVPFTQDNGLKVIKRKYNGFVEEGGSRSSKTYSIIQFWLYYAFVNRNIEKRVFICRAVGTWVTGSVLFDFLKIMTACGLSGTKYYKFNKSIRVVKLWKTEFWFFGLDDTQKIHGMTSDGFWLNEAMEADRDDFDNLEQRCSEIFILDYNPTSTEHWIYDNVCKRPDVIFNHSTMLNNDFLPENMRRKILSYQPTPENIKNGTADKNKWEIYGLGIRSEIEGLIFNNVTIVEQIPEYITRRYTGVDFGYTNDPTAIVEVAFDDTNGLYIDELCYQTYMLTSHIIKKLQECNNERKIDSESADPRMVDEIRLAGFDIEAVDKKTTDGKGSIRAGLDKMLSMRIYVTRRSMNAIKEFKNYKNKPDKDRPGKFLNEPLDDYNHIIDAVRYVVLTELLGRRPIDSSKLAEYFH